MNTQNEYAYATETDDVKNMNTPYSIGRQGEPWHSAEKQQWFDCQTVKRSYQAEVLCKLNSIPTYFRAHQYGALPINEARYPLLALLPKTKKADVPDILITGGVHGYETSGVQGAISFAQLHAHKYSERCNMYVLPCVSPWGYETINRWGPNTVDPNRNFYSGSPSFEANAVVNLLESLAISPLMHIDLHETTDTDNSEFRPALAARDAKTQSNWQIPDGFYLVANSKAPELAFQQHIINQVKQLTAIAPADDNGALIGEPTLSEGVIGYDNKALHLCAGVTGAAFATTTEVYPDSPRTNPHNCIDAQVTAVCAAIDFVLAD